MSETENDELQEYAKALDALAEEKSKRPWPNTDHAHAAIAIQKILQYSNKKFTLLDDNLSCDIMKNYDNFLKILKSALNREVEVRIIVRDDKSHDKNFYNSLKEIEKEEKDYFKLEKLKSVSECPENHYLDDINFAIGDSDKVRVEILDRNKERTGGALVSFNAPERVDRLKGIINNCSCESY